METNRVNVDLVPIETEDDFYFMSNLPPSFTGLPFLVWISQQGFARHDVRVKVSRSHKVKRGELIVVSHCKRWVVNSDRYQ